MTSKQKKIIRYARGYGMGEIKLARLIGQYPLNE